MQEDYKNIIKLAKMLENKQLLETEDLKAFTTDIVNAFAQHRSAFRQLTKEQQDTLNTALKQLNAEHDRILQELETTKQEAKSDTTEAIKKALSDCKKMCDEVMAMKPKDGKNGKDADEEYIIEELAKRIPQMPEIPDMEEYEEKVEQKFKKVYDHIKKSINGFPGVRALANLMDVSVSSPSDGEVLAYNSTTGRWENSASAGGNYSILTATGTIDDSNTAFTFSQKPTEVVINGLSYIENGGWAWSNPTATIDFPVGSGGRIYGRS